jgi:hypothetical protein
MTKPPAISRALVLIITIDDLPAATLYVPASKNNPIDLSLLFSEWGLERNWQHTVGMVSDNLFAMHFTTPEGVTGTAFASVFTATRH